jgi:hypothetical protein
MVWFWGLLVLAVVLLLCIWILIFIVDFRSCANVICTSDVTGDTGEAGEVGDDAGPAMAGNFGPLSVITGPRGKQGLPQTGPKGKASAGGLITGPRGDTGPVGAPPHTFGGLYFEDAGLGTLSTADGLIAQSILLNYYEEFETKCPLNVIMDSTEFPTATLNFIRFGRQVTMNCIIGDIRPQLLFNNPEKDGQTTLQPSYVQFSTAILNNCARFFVVQPNPWQYKTPVQVLICSSALLSDGTPVNGYNVQQPAELLIRTQTAQILMQLYATPQQGRFAVPFHPDPNVPLTYGLFGIRVTFSCTWNLPLTENLSTQLQ